MSNAKPEIAVESTGNPALDAILGGGIPARSLIVVAGEPGSGKTVVSMQMLFAAAQRGDNCLYFTTLSEPMLKVLRYMQQFSFFDPDVFERQVRFIDLATVLRQGAQDTLNLIEAAVAEHEPGFVVVDSFKVVGELLRSRGESRALVYDLAVQMSGWGATSLLVGDYWRDELSQFAEFSIADGVIVLGSERVGLTAVREIEVMKLRGAAPRTGRHFFEITGDGAAFFPRVSVPDDMNTQRTASPTDRVTMGIAGLDDLFGGGVPRGSATLVQGGTGTGKTLMGMQFLIEGANRGERGVFFTLEETPEQLRSSARALGWNLDELERDGKILLRYTSPVELSTDRFLNQARNEVRDLGARRAVFDSISTMALSLASERRFKELVYAITKYLRGAGVTLLLTAEASELLGSAQVSGHGASYMADNYVQIRYVEIEGRLDRALSVVKARGIAHNSELRELSIGDGGLRLIEGKFKDLRGVLTGLPSPYKV